MTRWATTTQIWWPGSRPGTSARQWLSQVLAVAADAHGFVSAGSDEGQPAVWVTANGRAWTTIDLPLSGGATGVLQQIAISGNRVTALGQRIVAGVTTPLAELSVDGGRTWRQVPFSAPGPDATITALTAGSGGFTAAVQTGAPAQQQVTIWTSTDGTSWTQSRVSGLPGGGSQHLAALAASGTAVTGIGSTATELGHQPRTLTLP